jgi:hypothetical protein
MNGYVELIPGFLLSLAAQLNEAVESSRSEPDAGLAAAKLRGAMTAVAIMLDVDAKVLRDNVEAHNGTH